MQEPIIKTISVYKSFDQGSECCSVLEDINLSIYPCTLTVIKGASGTGKTTLLNVLSSLDKPTSGQVFISGINITDQTIKQNDMFRKNNIGFIFQATALVSTMTAYENIELMLRVAGKNNTTNQKKIEKMLIFAGLYERRNHMIQELSGGEQQRIGIIRALIHEPKLIFADEPTSELDIEMGKKMVKWLISMAHEQNKTIILTTHDPIIIENADQIIELQK